MLRFISVGMLSASFMSTGLMLTSVSAADLPLFFSKHGQAKASNVKVKRGKAATVLPNDPLSAAAKPAVAAIIAPVTPNRISAKPEKLAINDAPSDSDAKLSWTLDPLVANADGGKNEGSASVSGDLVIRKPLTKIGPTLTIELIGHIIKTPQSEVRLDVQIGPVKRTVVWNSDQVKSGIFKIILDEKMPSGVLAETIHASAIAFVTKQGDGAAAMISLEKVNLHLGKVNVADVDADQ